MSHSISIPHPRPTQREHAHRLQLVLGSVLGIVVGAVVFALSQAAIDIVRDATPTQPSVGEPLSEFPRRELPREWRWERKAIQFDHMYRRKESPRLDWIRENGKR